MKQSKQSSAFAALAAAALFGASAPLSKILLGSIDPIPMAALLYLGSGIGAILFRFLLRVGGEPPQETGLTKADTPWLAGAILAGGVAAPIFLMRGLQHTPGATASLLLNFETVATTLIALVAFREAIGKRTAWVVALVTLAAILLSWNTTGGWGFSTGALAIVAACAFWGIDNNVTRQISAKDPLTIVLYKGLGAGLFSTLLALFLHQSFPGFKDILFAMLLGAASYGLSITLFILAMRGMGAARTSALFGSAPFAGALISFILLREQPGLLFYPAVLLMAVGTWLLVSEHHEHQHLHEAFTHDHRHAHDEAHHIHDHSGTEDAAGIEHAHPHNHEQHAHTHPHLPDIHHRHEHEDE